MNDTEVVLGIVPGPVFGDICGHGGYVASYEYLDEKYDLFVYDTPKHQAYGQSVCIRHGKNEEEYYSFHNTFMFVKVIGLNEIWNRAARILEYKGQFIWKPKKLIVGTVEEDKCPHCDSVESICPTHGRMGRVPVKIKELSRKVITHGK